MPYTIENLFKALNNFDTTIVRAILDESPSLASGYLQRKTPLTYIMSTNWRTHDEEAKEIVNILIKKGADVNEEDGFGVRPLQFAIATASARFVKALVDAGANQDFTIVDGNVEHTPLQYAQRIIDYKTSTDVIESLAQGVGHTQLQYAQLIIDYEIESSGEGVQHIPDE